MALSFKQALDIIDNYLARPDDYVFPFEIHEENGKVRTIITYKDNTEGHQLREIHTYIAEHISPFYQTSKHSYAYKKGCNCLQAVNAHLSSNMFIKLDISSFFETITKELFLSHYKKLFNQSGIKHRWWKLLDSVFYKGHLSLGFVTSPIISDIYLSEFDKKIEEYLSHKKHLVYSRYSDDILISSKKDNWTDLEALFEKIQDELVKFDLTVNKKKTKKVELNDKDFNSITFLGLNISKAVEGGNKITISKNFILFTLYLLKRFYNKEETDNPYLRSRILSRVMYMRKTAPRSYQRFLRKHINAFNKEYKGI